MYEKSYPAACCFLCMQSLLEELMCLHLLYLGILHIIQIYQFINFHMGFVSQLKYGLLDSILLLPSLLLFLNSNWF